MLNEENIKGTAFIIGRFQPITKLHCKIIDDARKKYQNTFVVVVNPKLPEREKRFTKKGELRTPEKRRIEKNPFSLSLRVKLIYKALEGKLHSSHIISAPTGFTQDAIEKIFRYLSKEKHKKNFVLLAGSDRVDEYIRQLKLYSNIDFSIKEITRDITSADNVSATKVRNAIKENDFETFKKLTPEGIHSEFNNLRKLIVSESQNTFFKKMLIETKLLQEGGLGGHMKHPHDMNSKEDFIQFFDDFLAGKLSATEKVDGLNLFVGYNKQGKVVAARNQNEEPFENIEDRFRKSHGGRTSFLAGFKAIKSFLEKLSVEKRKEYELIDEQENPKNFINLEIIYGPQPNIIPYSKSDNFIVFHNLSGTKENGYTTNVDGNVTSILKKMANKAKTTSSIQTEIEYVES